MMTKEELQKAFDEEHGPGAWLRLQAHTAAQTAQVKQLCEQMGYGFVMHEAERLWSEKTPGHNHTTGPCRLLMDTCFCVDAKLGPTGCDWCEGCGLLTKKVKRLIRRHANPNSKKKR